MIESLCHRGPDDEGIAEWDNCVLGHRRLSIIDIGGGAQPMSAGQARCAVAFNGEIYGYRELRASLSGYRFETNSDTEVLLALYQKHGPRMAERLPGMFAFAIWDEERQSLFAARDRFGEKPLFYARAESGQWLFASEIKALLASGLLRPRLSRSALAHYLRRLYVHPSQTIYENIHVLPPAHTLLIQDGQARIERYWSLPQTRDESLGAIDEREAIEEFRRLFERAVSRQMVADVPVAAFLSGGLDSSSVVAAAAQVGGTKLRTLAFGFGSSADEMPFAREVAARYGTEHIELEAPRQAVAELMIEMAHVYDEPFADSSNIPTYLISREARRHAKVVLSGDGGDELLAGYEFWYRPLWLAARASTCGTRLALAARPLLRVAARAGIQAPKAWRQKTDGARMVQQQGSILAAHRWQSGFFTRDEMAALGFAAGDEAPLPDPSDLGQTERGDLDDALRLDLLEYLPGDILAKTDRAAMAHGLELRAPFLDVELASFCIALPPRFKMTASADKWLLRQAYAEQWPESIRKRGKQGFGAPVETWLRLPEVAALKARVLSSQGAVCHLLPPTEVARIAARDDYQTWTLLVLGLWLEAGGQESL